MEAVAPVFRFGQRRQRIDWRLLHGIDLERLVRDTDLDALERVLSIVAFGDLDAEGPPGAVADVSLRRLLRLSQLANEYLLHVQDHLASRHSASKVAHDRAQKRAAALQQRCASYKQRADASRRAVRQAHRTIRAFEVLAGKMSYNELGVAHLQRGAMAAHDPSLLWKLERLEHEAASLRDEKSRLAAEAGQAHDLRNDRTRLAAEAEALRHTLAQHKTQAAASSAELSRAVEAARDAEHRAGRERLASALAAERRVSDTDARVPVEAAQLAAMRKDVTDADARYRRLDEAHAATLAQLAAVRAEASAAMAAAAEARVPRDDPHLQQLQRWLTDANTELTSLRKRLSEQERERCEEVIAAREQAARLQASNSELRRRVDELLDEAQRAAAKQQAHTPPQLAAPQPQAPPPQPAAGPPQGRTFDWHLAEIARLERDVNRLDKDNDGLRAENNRLATLLAERQPLVDHLHHTIDSLQQQLAEEAHMRMMARGYNPNEGSQQYEEAGGGAPPQVSQDEDWQRGRSPPRQRRRPQTAKRPRSAHSSPPPRRPRQQQEAAIAWQTDGRDAVAGREASVRHSTASQAGMGFPTRVQHPTLLSQSLSGPLEAAAPYLQDAPLLPHAQDRGFEDLIMPRPRSPASMPSSPGAARQLPRQRSAGVQLHMSPAQHSWPQDDVRTLPQQRPLSPQLQQQWQRPHSSWSHRQQSEPYMPAETPSPQHIDLQQPSSRPQTWSRPISARQHLASMQPMESPGPFRLPSRQQRSASPPPTLRAASPDQVPQPSEDDKAQFRQDLPVALRNAPRLGAVSQFQHSPDRFTMIRPEVEAELEAELANEMRAFGLDAAEERLSDARYRSALAALRQRRQEAMGRRGRQGAAHASYMHTTLPHYLHQAAIAAKQLELRTSAISGYQRPASAVAAGLQPAGPPPASPAAPSWAAAGASSRPTSSTWPASRTYAPGPGTDAAERSSLPRPASAAAGGTQRGTDERFYSPLKAGASLPRGSPTHYVASPLSAGKAAKHAHQQPVETADGGHHLPSRPMEAQQPPVQHAHSSPQKHVGFHATQHLHQQPQHQHQQEDHKQQHELQAEACNNMAADDPDDIPVDAYY